jgi:predicted aldo/keto reductase-like oxidoreductase
VRREDLYITTKIGPSSDVDEFKRNFETSMELLGIDYLDNLDFHGPGNLESIRPAMSERGCLGYVRKLMAAGTVRHFGFSTHGYPTGVMDLVNTGEFESINIHYYFFYQGLRDVVERAAELDLGVFIISPNAQGGRLFAPTPALEAACAPLHPMTFGHMWLLKQADVHTLSAGAARPEHLDLLLRAADFDGTGTEGELYDRVLGQVESAYRGALPGEYCTTCNQCLPCPENINIPGLLNMRNMSAAFGMDGYTKGRYSHVGRGGAWVLGTKGSSCTKCGDCLPRCPEKLDIPGLLWDTHQRLETGEVGRPRWEHEGDLLDSDLTSK